MSFSAPLRRAAAAVLATSAMFMGSVQPAAAAPPTFAPVIDYIGPISNFLTSLGNVTKAMAVLNASTANLAPMIQFQYSAGAPDNDRMVLERENTANVFRIKPLSTYSNDGNPFNDKCLAVKGNDTTHDNVPILNATCTYDSINNDVWFVDRMTIDGFRTVQFRNQGSSQGTERCIHTQAASTANGAALVSFRCTGSYNSLWLGIP